MQASPWKIRGVLILLLSVAFSNVIFTNRAKIRTSEAKPNYQNQSIAEQFQQIQNPVIQSINLLISNESNQLNYQPPYEIKWAHPLNYGERYKKDIKGVQVYNQPIIVLHETVSSAAAAIRHFQTPHENENVQVSYHTLIKVDGTVVYIVPPDKRAFGAGNSSYKGSNGIEAVKTHREFPPSVNNFAYHVSLETPADGRNNKIRHSGYSDLQYHSLAWLIAQSSVPDSRITTHKDVDRSGTRIDPRSFDRQKFLKLLHIYRRSMGNKSQTLSTTS